MRRIDRLRHYVHVVRDYVRMFGAVGPLYLTDALVLRRPRLVRVRRGWAPHPIFLRLATSDIQMFRQVFLDREYEVSTCIQRPVRTILDAGANVGLASIFFAMHYPDAAVVAVEPEGSNFAVLELNLSKYPNISSVRGALWGTDDDLQIRSEGVQNCSFTVERAHGAESPIHGFRISTLLKMHGWQDISILKMDIEGAEVEVFEDSESWASLVENIIVELHDRFRPGCTDAFLASTRGFTTVAKTRELTLATRSVDAASCSVG